MANLSPIEYSWHRKYASINETAIPSLRFLLVLSCLGQAADLVVSITRSSAVGICGSPLPTAKRRHQLLISFNCQVLAYSRRNFVFVHSIPRLYPDPHLKEPFMKRSRSAAGCAASSSAPTSAAALQLTRARIVATLPSLDSSALSSILTTLLTDSSVVHTVAALPLFTQAPALRKCAVCKKKFDTNLNLSTSACVSKEHDFQGEYDRGECPGCRQWDGCCGYCRCGATMCETRGFLGGRKHSGTSKVCRIGRHTTEYPFEDEEDDEDEDEDEE